MRSLPATLVLAPMLALGLLGATPATAHELTVLDPGSAELDLGDVSQPRLVHATLVEQGDTLTLSIGASRNPRGVLLLVPDAQPERSAGAGALPTMAVSGDRGGDDVVVDEVTGIGYRVVEQAPLGAGALELSVQPGDEPTRVAVLVGDPDAQFAAVDVERTPRTLLRLRGWAETPAEGSRSVDEAPPAAVDSKGPWYGLVIALVAVVTAAWWVRAGRARSRERGVERSRDGE